MGRSYATMQDTALKMIGDDSDDSDSAPVGIYEVEEISQEMYSGWSTSSSRYPSLSDRRRFPINSEQRHNISYVRGSSPRGDSDVDGLSSLFQRSTTNLFGRDFEEASSDLARLLRPSRPSPQNTTPSLTSDDTRTSSRTSSSSFSPHMTLAHELVPAPLQSSPTQPKAIEQVITEVPEGAVAWTEPRTMHAEESYLGTQLLQESPLPSLQVEESQDIDMPPIVLPPTPLPRLESTLTHTRDLSPSRNTAVNQQSPNRVVSGERPTVQFSFQVTTVHEDEDINELMGDEEDAYVPENSKHSRAPKRKNRKSGVTEFKCPQCPDASFTRNYDMLRHIKNLHEKPTYDTILARTCPCCFVVLSRKDAFKRHILRVPEGCVRYAQLRGLTFDPVEDPQLFALCRAFKPPLARSASGSVA
ncbi:hypothetical protein CPB84DRAFT_1761886 [Gymnopilus junonius]|uniref:C2H2-type domain-containing protein n=1 Tax=Gymnopilus junonius TaxID=109634 RepID=A0A9P5TTK6_GYMJU|nr:hypothetical protein CPB84DRAFT_1761886 [Gymnopilus junonius]